MWYKCIPFLHTFKSEVGTLTQSHLQGKKKKKMGITQEESVLPNTSDPLSVVAK